ncbi:hypothetical protein EMIHUDRAFT_96711 [Emiliania huxleyi CCMP1516]|uniref:Uncharacterized protein n=2 Tax=Emiliania huxleyi TaxID=2903 RepID=A0A0D3IDV3_EMIH1|nr:hypothetical protein EMIHUDRAFT_96711 [Emiliania huxleyi CCMP1516]EOD09438.1 hypothetical protein EMIHUDRAFT_96711 [Emiliania huxleyi CCMP1516]|eukprot:XP_005761867.1 hypothetical protein EMIHUDRAFT_96711 [Emiliania huxleyi CCMP1516]
MSLRWLLLAGLVGLCRGFAAVGRPDDGCEDADDTTVMQAARGMGLGDVMSCSDVAIQGLCSHPQAKEGTCDPNPNPTGTVTKVCPLGSLELAPSGDISDARPTLYNGNLACVAPKDGTQCDFRGQDGTPDYTPCSVSYTCSNKSVHGEDKYHHRPLQDCPRGTWSCVAYNGEDADGLDGVLKHSTVGSDPGKHSPVGSDPGKKQHAVPCWFPSLSPLGLELQGNKTKPAAQADLLEQCKHPPFVFAYDDPGPVSRTPEKPGVLPSTPTTFSCLKIAGDNETDIAPPEYSTFPQTEIATPCDPAGGNTSLGFCDDDNDCQAQCDNDDNCLGYSVQIRGGSGSGGGYTPFQESFTLKKYLGPACVEHNSYAHIRAKPAAVKPKRRFLIDQTLGTLEEWNRQCGETFWSQGTYDWMALEAGKPGRRTLFAPFMDDPMPTSAESRIGTALLQAQSDHSKNIATLTGGSTMERNSGFIPSFSYEFYVTDMGNYVEALTNLQTELEKEVEEEKALQNYIAKLRIEQAKLSGKESVAAKTQEMTMKTIATAITGMNAGMEGISNMGRQMNETTLKMKSDIDAWIQEQQTKAWLDFAFVVGDFALSVAAPMFAAASEGAKVEALFPWGKKADRHEKDVGKFRAPSCIDALDDESRAILAKVWKGKETWRKGFSELIKGVDSFMKGVVGITEAVKAVSTADGLSSDVRDAAGASVAAMEEQFGWTVT